MSSSVYFRSQLTDAQMKIVQRQQFAPTTQKHQQYYSGQQKTLYHLFKAEASVEEGTSIEDFLRPMNKDKGAVKKRPLDELAIFKNGFKLTNRDLATLINAKKSDDMRRSGEPGMLDEYLKMICQYINTVRNKEIAMKSPSCLTLTGAQYHAIRQGWGRGKYEELCIQTLRNLGFNSLHAFMELDFLLIPYSEYGHSKLLGIAPKQRFVFVIDSIPTQSADTKNDIVNGLKAILLTLRPDFTFSNDPTRTKPEDWSVFGQWSLRTKTTDGSPNAAQQRDEYNCGVFTSTTAFCLAFGFELTCFVEADLDKFKKPRMVAEFVNGGFFGPGFDHDALDLPQYRAKATSQAKPPKTQASASMPTPQYKVTKTAAPSRTLSTRIKRMLSTRKRKESDNDDQDQRGFGDEKEEEGSNGESDEEESLGFKKEPLYTRQQLAHALNLFPDNSSEKRNNTLPFPPQFSAKIHEQATLIYGGMPEGFNLQDRKYSKRELKKACRDFQVENWQPWSFERQGFFMKYVMNEIAGIMARRRGDDVKPFDGVGEVAVLKVETATIRTQPGRASKRRRKTVEVVQTVVPGGKAK